MDISIVISKAIQSALDRNWKQAIELNLQVIKQNPKDLDALNRLGRAYLETGQKTKSEQAYLKVLKLDKFNNIATKSLDLLKTSRVSRLPHGSSSSPLPIFLEEPGVTKTVSLTRLGDPKVICRLHPGDSVTIAAREHSVTVISQANEYLGRLPDDLASRMRSFLKAGNVYHAWIRSVDTEGSSSTHLSLKVFIKEVQRSSKFRNTPSFPITEKLTYAAFTPPELVHENKPVIPGTEEPDEFINPDIEVENQERENSLPPISDDD